MSANKKAGPISGSKPAAKPVPKPQSTNMLSFFTKTASASSPAATVAASASAPSAAAASSPHTPPKAASMPAATSSAMKVAAPVKPGVQSAESYFGNAAVQPSTAPSAAVAAAVAAAKAAAASPASASDSGRKRKVIKYAESDGDDGSDAGAAAGGSAKKGRKSAGDDDDDYAGGGSAMKDEPSSGQSSEVDEDEPLKTPAKKKAGGAAGGFLSGAGSAAAAGSSSSGKKAAAAKPAAKGKGKAAAAAAASMDGEEEERGGKPYSTPWLDPGNRKDGKKIPLGDPGYDPSTLYVPQEAYANFTPAERQYWDHKRVNADLTLFFKVGKFYEMFDEDAEVGVRELGLAYMTNQKRPHCGFPEAALQKYAEQLVAKGIKIGQVDQTETPDEMKAWNKANPKQPRRDVVNRQLSEVLTPGTLVDSDVLKSADANYLFAMTERLLDETEQAEIAAEFERHKSQLKTEAEARTEAAGSVSGSHANPSAEEEHNIFVVEFGFCYVDCTTGKFVIGQRRDDQQRSFLKTLLGQVAPRETIFPAGGLSPVTQAVLRLELPQNTMKNEKIFPAADKVVAEFNKKKYFAAAATKTEPASQGSSSSSSAAADPASQSKYPGWPKALQLVLASNQSLAISALGAIESYLERTHHAHELISLSHFLCYLDEVSTRRCLVLDGQTLTNLEIIKNEQGGLKGTLLEFVDRCITPFGKRMLKKWLTQPLFQISSIVERQDAVQFLMNLPSAFLDKLRSDLKSVPDLERFISRIHAHGQKKSINVIMYENVGAKKLDVFLKSLEAFRKLAAVLKQMAQQVHAADGSADGPGVRLQMLVSLQSAGGVLPDFEPLLDEVCNLFDLRRANTEKKILPLTGLDPQYDQACANLRNKIREADEFLAGINQSMRAGGKINWVHKGKERYQFELPEKLFSGASIPSEWQIASSTKTVKRYVTKETQELAKDIAKLELIKEEGEKDAARLVFFNFARHHGVWDRVVSIVGEIDCLASLALVSKNHRQCVRPEFVSFESNGNKAMLDLRQSVHPTLYEADNVNGLKPGAHQSFIANDVTMGVPDVNPARFVLVSGPNMGGKSTLLRQTCCAVILAQVGCWIPAESCRLTPVDRIFTRVGANDAIMAGKSTFLVELSETSVILKNATSKSLVILDELGRGTSTFDGTAIAYSVIKFLSERVDCLALFSSHYHMLFDTFSDNDKIALYHMACQVNSSDTDVTFLYKFIRGVASKSYGNNVAAAAGLPPALIKRAKEMSEEFERRCIKAMGNTRARLSAAFPAQKSTSDLALPPTSARELTDALKAGDYKRVLALRNAYKIAQLEFKQTKHTAAHTEAMQTA